MRRNQYTDIERRMFGVLFTDALAEWKSKEKGRTQESFGKLLYPPASRQSVIKWSKGTDIPNPARLIQICKVLEVPDDYFDFDSAHSDLYRKSSAYITEIGKASVQHANEIDLDLNFVKALHKITDFNSSFPLHADQAGCIPAKPAPIDKELSFLQIEREKQRVLLSDLDLDFLKTVQDKVIDYVQYLFYTESKKQEIMQVPKIRDATQDDIDHFLDGTVKVEGKGSYTVKGGSKDGKHTSKEK